MSLTCHYLLPFVYLVCVPPSVSAKFLSSVLCEFPPVIPRVNSVYWHSFVYWALPSTCAIRTPALLCTLFDWKLLPLHLSPRLCRENGTNAEEFLVVGTSNTPCGYNTCPLLLNLPHGQPNFAWLHLITKMFDHNWETAVMCLNVQVSYAPLII